MNFVVSPEFIIRFQPNDEIMDYLEEWINEDLLTVQKTAYFIPSSVSGDRMFFYNGSPVFYAPSVELKVEALDCFPKEINYTNRTAIITCDCLEYEDKK